MLKFSARVRNSLAVQFIRASWLGSAGFGFLGWDDGSGIVVALTAAWWLAFQFFGHLIMALEVDSDCDSGDDSS